MIMMIFIMNNSISINILIITYWLLKKRNIYSYYEDDTYYIKVPSIKIII